MDDYKHYIRIDGNGIITHGYSDAFEQPLTGDIQLSGNFGRHFQFNLYTDRRQLKYKLANGQMVERTQEELDLEWAARPAPPKTAEQKKFDKLAVDNEQLNLQVIDLFEQLIIKGVL